MRIAAVYPHASIHDLDSLDNALAVLLWEMSRRLAATDQSALILGGSPGPHRKETKEGVEIFHIPVFPDQILGQLRRLDGIVFRDPDRPFRSTGLYYRLFDTRAIHLLRKWAPDIVHIHAIPNFLPPMRRNLPDARLVMHSHDHRLLDYDSETTGRMLFNADLILGCSQFISGSIAARFLSLAARCSHMYNGVDERFLSKGRERRAWSQRVLFVGRLSPEKGVHTLIQAFRMVAEDFPMATLDLVGPEELAPLEFVENHLSGGAGGNRIRAFYTGDASYPDYLRSIAPDYLGSRIRFLGRKSHATLPEVFEHAGIFAFPSVWEEPFGMPVVEAMGAGLPIVATDAGAFPETIDEGRTGIMVERGNVEKLAAALRSLLSSEHRRARLGASGYTKAAREFTWNGITAGLRQKYALLLEQGQSFMSSAS